jgi:hypothetical protein
MLGIYTLVLVANNDVAGPMDFARWNVFVSILLFLLLVLLNVIFLLKEGVRIENNILTIYSISPWLKNLYVSISVLISVVFGMLTFLVSIDKTLFALSVYALIVVIVAELGLVLIRSFHVEKFSSIILGHSTSKGLKCEGGHKPILIINGQEFFVESHGTTLRVFKGVRESK